jgi:hypothetical protein
MMQSVIRKFALVLAIWMHMSDDVMLSQLIRYGLLTFPYPGQPWATKSTSEVIVIGACEAYELVTALFMGVARCDVLSNAVSEGAYRQELKIKKNRIILANKTELFVHVSPFMFTNCSDL